MNSYEINLIGKLNGCNLESEYKSFVEDCADSLTEEDLNKKHEVVHSSDLLIGLIENWLLYHPSIIVDEKAFRLARISQMILSELNKYLND